MGAVMRPSSPTTGDGSYSSEPGRKLFTEAVSVIQRISATDACRKCVLVSKQQATNEPVSFTPVSGRRSYWLGDLLPILAWLVSWIYSSRMALAMTERANHICTAHLWEIIPRMCSDEPMIRFCSKCKAREQLISFWYPAPIGARGEEARK